jgi:hypothetical protein
MSRLPGWKVTITWLVPIEVKVDDYGVYEHRRYGLPHYHAYACCLNQLQTILANSGRHCH